MWDRRRNELRDFSGRIAADEEKGTRTVEWSRFGGETCVFVRTKTRGLRIITDEKCKKKKKKTPNVVHMYIVIMAATAVAATKRNRGRSVFWVGDG